MNELLYRIALTQIKGIGPIEAQTLISKYGSAENFFNVANDNTFKLEVKGYDIATQARNGKTVERARREIEWMQKHKIAGMTQADKTYPFRLKECPDAPVVLYAIGNTNLDAQHIVGIVGTRLATDYGRKMTRNIVTELAQNTDDLASISGLAEGIDGVAHKISLDNNIKTVAVMAHGLDRIYPQIHRQLAQRIIDNGGMLLTEYISGTEPIRSNFLARNRIIAGLSDAVVVTESAKRGGALSTANCALSYNRDVFAVPGRVDDEHSEGCNNLIKSNKAIMIESADDLMREMGWKIKKPGKDVQTELFTSLTDDDKQIITLLHQNPNGMQSNQIALKLQMPISSVASKLMTLEFSGLVRCLPGNMYKLA